MNTITNHLRDRLYLTAFERDSNSYHSLRVSQWSEEFEKLQRNRLVIGAIRYGKLHEKGKSKFDRVSCIRKRIKKY